MFYYAIHSFEGNLLTSCATSRSTEFSWTTRSFVPRASATVAHPERLDEILYCSLKTHLTIATRNRIPCVAVATHALRPRFPKFKHKFSVCNEDTYADGKTVDNWSSDEDHIGTQNNGFQDIGSGTDATVHEHLSAMQLLKIRINTHTGHRPRTARTTSGSASI